jgi:putative ABC transport system permease protein
MSITQPPSYFAYFSRLAFLPILSAMLKQKYLLLMIVMQIALTLAVLSNGLFIIEKRLDLLQRPSGIDEANTFVLTSSGFTADFNPTNSIQTDLAQLRQMPNIVNAVSTYSFPYSGGSEWDELQTTAGENQNQVPAASYNLDEQAIEALGLHLIAGDNFNPTDVLWQSENSKTIPSVAIITSSVASNLFNTHEWSKVLGKTIYINKLHPVVIKGVVQQLQAPWDPLGKINNSIIYPRIVTRNSSRYFIRTLPGQLKSSMDQVVQHLASNNQQRMIRKVQTIASLKKQVYAPDIAAVSILSVVICALTIIAALGIAGTANLNVLKNYKQIGIRRALGANKMDIFVHCLTENFIQTTAAVIIGCILALGLNIFLVEHYGLPKLPMFYLLVSVFFMYALGVLSTLKSTLKAMNISPAEATKSA